MESSKQNNKKLDITNWENLGKAYNELLNRDINSLDSLKSWLYDRDNIDSAVSEEMGWRYINMTRDTSNTEYAKLYSEYLQNIIPKAEAISDKLNRKVIDCNYISKLQNEPGFDLLIKSLKNDLRIFKTENIKLITDLQLKSQEYNSIVGSMTIKLNGKEVTLQQAATKLEETNRSIREDIYKKIGDRRLQEKDRIDEIFSEMITKRDEIAKNANCKTFTEYMFIKLKRFDYTIEDCLTFHDVAQKEIVPIIKILAGNRKKILKLDNLKPWDLSVDIYKKPPLRPFENEKELLEKTINTFNKINPFFGECIKKMDSMGHLDLLSRKNKAPGGYNYPLNKTGIPFIFMNATHTFDDMITMLHEGGHAIHSFLTKDLYMSSFKNAPLEVSEVASMGMELITMEYWSEFFNNKEELLRAKILHLNRIISILPWVATIDKFQHWLYDNPNHSIDERKTIWNKILDDYSDGILNWKGQENYRDYLWQKQLHLFEVPFYYIEYAIAQLAAISIWKNFNEDPKEGIKKYIEALKLGSMKSIPETYKTAGIKFSFDQEYIKDLMHFIKDKIAEVNNSLKDVTFIS